MASAKTTAMNQLGSENKYIGLDALNNERKVANQTYNTNVSALQNAYNALLDRANSNRIEAKQDFGMGRNTVDQSQYMLNRGISADKLGARGVANGSSQLSGFGTSLQANNSNSNLANTYYNTLDDINTTVKTGTDEYNTNMSNAKNTLDKALADIATREANARNAYRQAVAALAEQIQARWDSNANAAKARKAAAKEAKDNAEMKFKENIIGILGNNPTQASYKNAADYYHRAKGGSMSDAYNYLYTTMGVGTNGVNPNGTVGPVTPWYGLPK